ncbi:MAG: hypothetical protein AB8G15_02455 [Saprospiraceae bacterium]
MEELEITKQNQKEELKKKKAVEEFLLSSPENFLFLYGSGGMGKTYLLYDVVKKIEEEPIYFLVPKNSTFEELFELCFDLKKSSFSKNQLYRKFISLFEKESIHLSSSATGTKIEAHVVNVIKA